MKMKHLCISHIFDAWDLISLEETGSLSEFSATLAASNLPVSTFDSTGLTSLHVTKPEHLSSSLGCGSNGIISPKHKVHFNFWVNTNILRDFFSQTSWTCLSFLYRNEDCLYYVWQGEQQLIFYIWWDACPGQVFKHSHSSEIQKSSDGWDFQSPCDNKPLIN